MAISKKWRRMRPIYRYFAGDSLKLDFSESAELKMYNYESLGVGDLKLTLFSGHILNGYAVGKHWMDVQVQMWKDCLKEGTICLKEIYEDFPDWHWWLNKVIGNNNYVL